MHKPNPTAIYYSTDKVRYDYTSRCYRVTKGKDGTLWSKGTFPTNIRVKDLPDYYIYVYLYGGWKYLRATGVKDMKYVPNNWVNHFLKDDVLYISYDNPLEITTSKYGSLTCDNYDIALFGNSIMDFIAATKYYSGYDTSELEQAVKNKFKLFQMEHPHEAEHFNGWTYNPEEFDTKVRENKLWRGI